MPCKASTFPSEAALENLSRAEWDLAVKRRRQIETCWQYDLSVTQELDPNDRFRTRESRRLYELNERHEFWLMGRIAEYHRIQQASGNRYSHLSPSNYFAGQARTGIVRS
ncbi:hypothetical protein H072_6287 [Dactylellina haptotyla CBS 200.50]|uniref:Uncharacterized protein n=1 Tax=Dactylellina haptotyla (strain CBS 200.50) TaxID=1284197 RepID=S8A9Y5_DACHA|nr:hypothetical protein H072_6287 [Dactylellina haptotyla CBS 200.50]